ncbi:MAG: diguanylate cyclase [Candidatus Brocadiae bacterium]|nr:diguanylate cyclase [Candidatus Brocadiia bacterium]
MDDLQNESRRLELLHTLRILDTPPDPVFDGIVRLACRIFDVPMAAVTFVDRDRQWLKARVGIDFCATPREDSFCTWTIRENRTLVVPNAAQDSRFSQNPYVCRPPGIRFYAGAPTRLAGGERMGALCILDIRPRTLSIADQEALGTLSDLISDALQLRVAHAALAEQAETLLRIVGSAGEGIIVVDPRGHFILFNNRAEELLGRGAEDVSLEKWSEIYGVFREDGVTRFPAGDLPLARALRGESTNHVPLIIRSARMGRDVKIEVSGRPIRGPEGIQVGAMVTFGEVTSFRAEQARLAGEARTDPLTGLANRRALEERLALHAAEASRGRKVAVLMADLDHFKRINDSAGHAEGDRVLRQAAEAFRGTVRSTDLVARYGGEEFCVVLPDAGTKEAVEIAEKLRRRVNGAVGPAELTVSIGVASTEALGLLPARELLEAADRALYHAKVGGRDRVEVAEPHG